MLKRILPVLRFIILWAIGHGIILWLNEQEIYLDRWIARMLGDAMRPDTLTSISWILSGLFALILTIAWEAFQVSDKATKAIRRATQPSWLPFAQETKRETERSLQPISTSVISTPAIEKTDAIKFELPKSLDTLTNHELRLTAYNLQSHVKALTWNYFHQLGEMNLQNISANERASRLAALDQTLNREFRATYADDILTLQKKILSRMKDNQTPMRVTAKFPNRILNGAEIDQAVNTLAALSNQLQ